MRAVAVIPDERAVRVIDHSEPSISTPTDVKLRMHEVGICGTDREITRFDYGAPPSGSQYLVIGHESLGEVVEVGPRVTRVKPGDLVVTMVRRPCSHAECRPCREDRQDFCTTGDYTERGINGAHGFMTELVVDDERFMNVVPPGMREVAVLTEPLTIAEKGLEQVWQVQQRLPWGSGASTTEAPGKGLRAVVLGAGPVGLLGAMALVVRGFDTFIYSRASGPHDKAKLAGMIGARYIAAEDSSVDDLAKQVGNIDLVYEATGAATVSFDVMRVVGINGVFVFTGVPGRKAPIEVDADDIMRAMVLENQLVLGTVNAPRAAFEAAIVDLGRFMKRFPDAVRALITSRVPIDSAPGFLTGAGTGIKNVVTLG
jgi:threonine dehydrogenase-like Zn-dependent dehydrogenase